MSTDAPKRRGRPPMPEDQRQTERMEIRMTAAQRAKLDRIGGAAGGAQWLRDCIDAAREPK